MEVKNYFQCVDYVDSATVFKNFTVWERRDGSLEICKLRSAGPSSEISSYRLNEKVTLDLLKTIIVK